MCVKRWMLLLNLHSFRLSQKSTSSGNYSRVRFWTCLSRLRRPLGGARLFCDVAELVAGIHCRWLREQECSLINVPLGGNFHASSYPIDPPSSCEFAMLEFCGGYCKKKAKRETYSCSLLVYFQPDLVEFLKGWLYYKDIIVLVSVKYLSKIWAYLKSKTKSQQNLRLSWFSKKKVNIKLSVSLLDY